MKIQRHHLKHMRLATWHILIALVGFLFALEIWRAHQMTAYLEEEALILTERVPAVQASGSVR
jgi:hypothetical protein